MIPQGVEIRPELQLESDVLAFGFSGGDVDDAAVGILGGALLDHLLQTATPSTHFVVADLRNLKHLSSVGIGRLLSLHRKLRQVDWKLILLISDPVTREVFAVTSLDRLFSVVADEAALHDLVNGRLRSAVAPGALEGEEVTDFSEEEIAEMDAAGVTLDDAIRVVERHRLSVEERIQLAQEIWDSLAPSVEQHPLSDAQRNELDRRLANLDADPTNVIPWEEVEARAHARFQK